MSASVKYSTISNEQVTEYATKIALNIKDILIKDIKKEEQTYSQVKVEVWTTGHGIRPFGNNAPTDYIDLTLKMRGLKVEGLGTRDVNRVLNKAKTLLKADNRLPIDRLEITDSEIRYSYGLSDSETLPTQFRLYSKPCKEFVQMNRMIQRYTAKNIAMKDLYSVNLFGKRGQYDESGDQNLRCYNSAFCQSVIDWIRTHKLTSDTLSVKVEKRDYIDDLDYSIRYETECYGQRVIRLVLAVTTKGGKVKATTEL